MVTDYSVEKDVLRKEFRAARRAMTEAEFMRESSILRARLATHPALVNAKEIHTFWPMTDRREPDLRPLLDAWHAEGRRIWLPVVRGARLRAGRYTGSSSLKVSAFGIMEPAVSPRFRADGLDVVIVPALAVDRAGFRLGYGGGFYDRWLQGVHAETVCPIFGCALVEALPHEDHDVPMKHIVTSA